MTRTTAKTLTAAWGLVVQHALYNKEGKWFHRLTEFPGALLDEHGFVIFDTEVEFLGCPDLRIRQDVGVPNGLKSMPTYTYFADLARPEEEGFAETNERKIREGARRDVVQSVPERDREARAACIKQHGDSCLICGFSFLTVYGERGRGFIHVHHKTPLAEGERDVDPAEDLIPVCPNCHAMLHRGPMLAPDELRAMLTINH